MNLPTQSSRVLQPQNEMRGQCVVSFRLALLRWMWHFYAEIEERRSAVFKSLHVALLRVFIAVCITFVHHNKSLQWTKSFAAENIEVTARTTSLMFSYDDCVMCLRRVPRSSCAWCGCPVYLLGGLSCAVVQAWTDYRLDGQARPLTGIYQVTSVYAIVCVRIIYCIVISAVFEFFVQVLLHNYCVLWEGPTGGMGYRILIERICDQNAP